MTSTASSNASPRRRWLLLLSAALLIILAWFGYRALQSRPAVPATQFTLLSGQRLSTEYLRGKVYLVNFWATSCTTCVKEMPQLTVTYQKYQPQGLELIAVAMVYDPPMYVMNFAQTRALPFKVAMDSDGSVARAFGEVQLTPTTFLVDKQGRILKRYVGEPEWNGLHQLIEAALAHQA